MAAVLEVQASEMSFLFLFFFFKCAPQKAPVHQVSRVGLDNHIKFLKLVLIM